MSETMKI